MKKSMMQIVLSLLLCAGIAVPVIAQESSTTTESTTSAKQDMKNAGKSTARATKKTYHKGKRTTKKGVHKVAHKTSQGANKVEEKTNPQ